MYPIIFDANTINFSNRGYGSLSSCLSCVVTEELNGEYELELKYPKDGNHAEYISLRNIIVCRASFSRLRQPFRIYNIKNNINGTITVQARHISYDLSGWAVSPFPVNESDTPHGAQECLTELVAHRFLYNESAVAGDQDYFPFSLTTDLTNTTTTMTCSVPSSMRSLMGGTDGSVLDIFGGEWNWNEFNCNLCQQRGFGSESSPVVTIKYGKNLTKYDKELQSDSQYSHIIAYWKKTVDDEEVVVYSDAQPTKATSYMRVGYTDVSSDYEEQPTVEELNLAAIAYISSNSSINKFSTSIDVDYVQMDNERVGLGDYVRIWYEGEYFTSRIITTKWNVLKDKYDTLEVGDKQANIVDVIKSISSSSSGTTSGGGTSGVVDVQVDGNSVVEDSIAKIDLTTKQDVITEDNKLPYSLLDGTPTIPTSTSELENDSGFVTSDEIPTKVSELENDAGFTTTTALETFEEAVTKSFSDVQEQLDETIETWYYTGVPTLSNEPAKNWSDNETKANHVGDLYYDKATGYCYHFLKDGSIYKWEQIQDQDIKTALDNASTAQDTADGKRTVVYQTATPTGSFDKGDLWVNGSVIKVWNGTDWVSAAAYLLDDSISDLYDNIQTIYYTSPLAKNGYTATGTGYVNYKTGSISSSSVYSYYEFNVSTIASFSYLKINTTTSYDMGIAFYNSDGTYLDGVVGIKSASKLGYSTANVNVPDNAVTCRLTMLTDTSTYGNMFIMNPAPRKPSAWVTETSDSNSVWTSTAPALRDYSDTYEYYYYMCSQMETQNKSVTTSAVTQYDDTNSTTVITKNTVTTSYVNALGITALNIAADSVITNEFECKNINASGGQLANWTVAGNYLTAGDTDVAAVQIQKPTVFSDSASITTNNFIRIIKKDGTTTYYPLIIYSDGTIKQSDSNGAISTWREGILGFVEGNDLTRIQKSTIEISDDLGANYRVQLGKNGIYFRNENHKITLEMNSNTGSITDGDGNKYYPILSKTETVGVLSDAQYATTSLDGNYVIVSAVLVDCVIVPYLTYDSSTATSQWRLRRIDGTFWSGASVTLSYYKI